ncbi:MAG TPA: YicC family protein [Flavobacteriales bacterium]|jgi:uncharacterized protein (TIGR00255 family)|nr:YicC family protein [Flavobacteriales bacterium]
MIKSMTGFGKSQAAIGLKTLTIDIRALNSKQLDLNLRLPQAFREKEGEVRNLVSVQLERGKVDVFVSLKNSAAAAGLTLNTEAFKVRYSTLKNLADELGADTSNLFSELLKSPDLMQEEETEAEDTDWTLVLEHIKEALKQVDGFRVDEGKGLGTELLDRVSSIEKLLESIAVHEESRMVSVRARLKAKIDELVVQTESSANRFEEEMIYFMEKLDISEEKQRLRAHCTYFKETSAEGTPSGRKLAFISQEMGREINTIGSKANHAEMQKIVVMMKDELEKIKEQLNNVL